VFADRVQDRGREVSRKAGPQQEHGIDPVQARVQSAWDRQVTAHDLNAARQAGGGRVAGQHSDDGIRALELSHDMAANIPGRPGYQNHPGDGLAVNVLEVSVVDGVHESSPCSIS
jgi:hypothetical protein